MIGAISGGLITSAKEVMIYGRLSICYQLKVTSSSAIAERPRCSVGQLWRKYQCCFTSSGLGPKTDPGIFQLGQPTQIIWTRALPLIRPPDIYVSEGLKLYCCSFFYETPISYTSTPRPLSNVYHRFGRRVYSTFPLSILPPLSSFLHGWGSKSLKFGLDLRHHSSLSRFHFETKQHIDTKVSYLMPLVNRE